MIYILRLLPYVMKLLGFANFAEKLEEKWQIKKEVQNEVAKEEVQDLGKIISIDSNIDTIKDADGLRDRLNNRPH